MTKELDKSAVIICDMWDKHWSKGATERVNGLALKINAVINKLREKGIQIIHAPSEVTDYYKETSARKRILEAPLITPPGRILNYDLPLDPPLPIDDSDEGSDTGETVPVKVWTRQHPAIEIDQIRDVLSEDGKEIYSFLQNKDIENIFIMGVHANMCVLKRPFGIRQMKEWSINIALVGDLTDAMYNPSMPPYVSHKEGTRLVVEYIRNYWCPVVTSGELLNILKSPE